MNSTELNLQCGIRVENSPSSNRPSFAAAAQYSRDADARADQLTRRVTGSTCLCHFSSVRFMCCEQALTQESSGASQTVPCATDSSGLDTHHRL